MGDFVIFSYFFRISRHEGFLYSVAPQGDLKLSVPKRCVPKTLAFAFGLRLRSKTQCFKTRVLERRLPNGKPQERLRFRDLRSKTLASKKRIAIVFCDLKTSLGREIEWGVFGRGGFSNNRFVLKPNVAIASEVSILSKNSLAITDFHAKKTQHFQLFENPLPGTPPIRDFQTSLGARACVQVLCVQKTRRFAFAFLSPLRLAATGRKCASDGCCCVCKDAIGIARHRSAQRSM